MIVKVARFFVNDVMFKDSYTYFGIFQNTAELSNFILENKADGNGIEIMKLETVNITKEYFDYLANNAGVDAEIAQLLYGF